MTLHKVCEWRSCHDNIVEKVRVKSLAWVVRKTINNEKREEEKEIN